MPLPASLLALAALALVLGLIWALARLARRFGFSQGGMVQGGMAFGGLALGARPATQGGPGLALAGSIALDPRRRVHLLRCGERHVLVLTGGGRDLLLGWLAADGQPETTLGRPDGADAP